MVEHLYQWARPSAKISALKVGNLLRFRAVLTDIELTAPC